jgi:hypothetical protein
MRSEAMDWLGNRYRDGQSGIHEKHPNLGAGECCLPPPHRVIGVSEESWEAAARGTATVRSHASPDVRQNVTIENGQVTSYRAIRSTAGGDPARIHTGSPVLSSDRCIPLLGSGVECDEEAPVGEFVNVNVTDGLATIRIDRPPMNALNAQIQRELSEAAAEVGADPEVRAAVIYGGPKLFAAGADVREMADKAPPGMTAATQRRQAAFTAIAKIPKPVVAAITGYALGGGLELALCADFRVCGEGAKLGTVRRHHRTRLPHGFVGTGVARRRPALRGRHRGRRGSTGGRRLRRRRGSPVCGCRLDLF